MLLTERLPELWSAIQKVKGTRVIGAAKEEVEYLVRGLEQWRKPRVFYAS